MLNPVGRNEKGILAVNRDHRDNHPGEHQRRTNRAKKSEREQQAARELSQRCHCCEPLPRAKSKRLHKTASAGEPITAKPPEELLRSVRREDETEDDTDKKQSKVEQL